MKHMFLAVYWMVAFLFASTHVMAVSDEEAAKIEQAMPQKAVVQPERPRTLLVFSLSNGFKHSCIPYWQKALDIMGPKTGAFKVVQSSDMSVFTAESLKAFDGICFNNTTKLTPDAAQQKAIMEFIQGGKGIIGIHAATDNFYDWPEGMEMMGGVFSGHPWMGDGTWAIKIDEPQHPLMRSFKGQGFKIKDEIYRTAAPLYSRAKQRVLMSLDMSDPATKNAKGVTPEGADTGISWIKPVGKGRLFYCSLGHDHAVTWNPAALEHYLAGIQYALGDLKVDDKPIAAPAAGLTAEAVEPLIGQIRQYEWSQSRAPLAKMEEMIRQHSGDAQSRQLLEMKIVEAMQQECTLAAKDFFCRMLAGIGTANAVPALSDMLKSDSTFAMARFALNKIQGQEAESALLKALGAVQKPEQKAALITSLGVRRSQSSTAAIASLIGDANPVIAEAAIAALAAIGSEQSAQALEQAAVSDAAGKMRLQKALLRCAESLARDGQSARARGIYDTVYANSADSVIKAAAFIGSAQTADSKADGMALDALQSADAVMVRAAVKVIARTPNKQLLENAAAAAGKLPGPSQIQLVSALAENKLKVGAKAAEQLAGSSDKDVRMAAYQALGSMGEPTAALLLAKAAASAQDRDEGQAAQDSLCYLPGADRAIVKAISDDDLDGNVRIQLIQAAAERHSKDAVGVLLRTAESVDTKIAEQSMRALRILAGPPDVEPLTDLAVRHPGPSSENALIAAALKIDDAAKRADGLLSRYAAVSEPESKAALLRVMGKLGDPDSVSVLTEAFRSADPIVSEAAFRGMTEWPGGEFKDKMKEIARSATDQKRKVLAFRAYVRMLGADSAALIGAYRMAERPDEKKFVIAAMAEACGRQALNFLEKVSKDPELKAEAEASLISVCQKVAKYYPKEVNAILKKIVQEGSNEGIKKRAQELLWDLSNKN